MKLTEKEKEICDIFSKEDKQGNVNCNICPLMLDMYLDAPACYCTCTDKDKNRIKREHGVKLPRLGKDKLVAYICGEISSRIDTYQYYFADAETVLSWMGFTVLNPATMPIGLHKYDDYMRISKAMLLSCDYCIFLDGWENSGGARQEYEWAKKHNKRIGYYTKERVMLL